jgi:hypothetical protein
VQPLLVGAEGVAGEPAVDADRPGEAEPPVDDDMGAGRDLNPAVEAQGGLSERGAECPVERNARRAAAFGRGKRLAQGRHTVIGHHVGKRRHPDLAHRVTRLATLRNASAGRPDRSTLPTAAQAPARRLCVPSHRGARALCLQALNHSVRSSVASCFTGVKAVPLWLPSQKGWRALCPQAHHQ